MTGTGGQGRGSGDKGSGVQRGYPVTPSWHYPALPCSACCPAHPISALPCPVLTWLGYSHFPECGGRPCPSQQLLLHELAQQQPEGQHVQQLRSRSIEGGGQQDPAGNHLLRAPSPGLDPWGCRTGTGLRELYRGGSPREDLHSPWRPGPGKGSSCAPAPAGAG